MLTEVEYLGYNISNCGLRPSENKVKGSQRCPKTYQQQSTKLFVGLANYYSRFLPRLLTTRAALYELLKQKTIWSWSTEHEKAFQMVKDQLSSSTTLAHYDPNQKLFLTCDASSYGLGAVLSQQVDDGTERPFAFASRSLSTTKRKYSQLDKEGLAIIFGVTRFRQYLLGHHLLSTLITNL